MVHVDEKRRRTVNEGRSNWYIMAGCRSLCLAPLKKNFVPVNSFAPEQKEDVELASAGADIDSA
jgi:hypothetical protein